MFKAEVCNSLISIYIHILFVLKGVQMTTRKRLCNIKGISEAKMEKIKEACTKIAGVYYDKFYCYQFQYYMTRIPLLFFLKYLLFHVNLDAHTILIQNVTLFYIKMVILMLLHFRKEVFVLHQNLLTNEKLSSSFQQEVQSQSELNWNQKHFYELSLLSYLL